MNRTPATRYSSAAMFAFMLLSLLFLLVHCQHALGDQEAAENIDRGEYQRDEAERARPQRAAIVGGERYADRQQGADHDHRGDGVGHRHQWRVQRRCHRPDDVVADEHRQHEDREPEYEGIDCGGDVVHVAFPQAAVFGMKFGWMMAPSRVSAVPLMISSSQLTTSFFSFLSIMVSTKV